VNARALGAPDAASAIAKIEGLMMMDDRMRDGRWCSHILPLSKGYVNVFYMTKSEHR
jgi:hypothetical protein